MFDSDGNVGSDVITSTGAAVIRASGLLVGSPSGVREGTLDGCEVGEADGIDTDGMGTADCCEGFEDGWYAAVAVDVTVVEGAHVGVASSYAEGLLVGGSVDLAVGETVSSSNVGTLVAALFTVGVATLGRYEGAGTGFAVGACKGLTIGWGPG